MAYKHGVIVSEVPTTVLPPVEVSAAIPIVFGTAPVNMTDPTCVNKPVLAYSYDEAVAALGYVPPAEQGASRSTLSRSAKRSSRSLRFLPSRRSFL